MYKPQVRPSLEYCSHVGGGAPKSSLRLPDKAQSKTIRLINNPNLTNSLQSLSHRRLIADLFIFYHYFHGHCSLEIKNIISDPERRVQTTRSSIHSHSFQVTIPTPRTLTHKTSFIPITLQLWNLLPESRKMSNLPPAPTFLLIAFLSIQPRCEVFHVVSQFSSCQITSLACIRIFLT